MCVYRWLGVDNVYLREHDTQLSMMTELEPYVRSGFLEYEALPAPGEPRLLVQTDWYNECALLRRAEKTSWVGFIDLDEFMVVMDKCASFHLF